MRTDDLALLQSVLEFDNQLNDQGLTREKALEFDALLKRVFTVSDARPLTVKIHAIRKLMRQDVSIRSLRP